MVKYVIKADDGCDKVCFEFDDSTSAMAFGKAAFEHLAKAERAYHDGGITISITEVKPVEEPDDDNNNEKENE